MFEHFTNSAIAVIMQAQEEARSLGHNFVGSEQILLGIVKEGSSIAAKVLNDFGVTLARARDEVEVIIGRGSGSGMAEIPFTPKVKQVFEQAFQEARSLDHPHIEPEHLLLSLTHDSESVAYRVMSNLGLDPVQVRQQLLRIIGEVAAVPAVGSRQPQDADGTSRSSALTQFGTDLTQLAAAGRLDPMVGRSSEIERVIQILGRRTKNNPVLIGEPGVGKTAIAEGLAQRIVNQDVPEGLQNRRVISLDLAMLVSGTRFRGDFEERLNQVMEEVRQAQNIILVIDELHTLIGAGALDSNMDAANLLKPALARGELQCIGATTLDEYRRHIEKDAALARRFQPVMVEPPSVETTLDILQGLRSRYEQFHRLTITDEALTAAATLADRYIPDRHLPDKAIDLIDEAGSRVRLRYGQQIPAGQRRRELRQLQTTMMDLIQQQKFEQVSELRHQEQQLMHQLMQSVESLPAALVTAEDIAAIVSAWTGVPVTRLTESESAMLLHFEDILHERIIGQQEAVAAVARAIRRSRVGMRSPHRPIASLIFSGPTGVGKTELAKALAAAVFGSEEAMVRLDMSELMEPQSVAKLIGAPPGYVGYGEGGQLTEAVRRQPYTVVLLDEIEKAHPDVFNLLLQLLDDGSLRDSQGRQVSFKNTVIIMTSNIGSRVIEKGGSSLGFEMTLSDEATSRYHNIRNLVNEEMKQYFRPELLNRVDEIIVFRQLVKSEVAEIAELLLRQVNSQLAERQLQLILTPAFKERLIHEGYDPRYGARPMRRAIARLIEDPLAEAILAGQLKEGDTATFDINDDGQVVINPARQPALARA
jgi:ATP-dependent Clp protease ATP-binding subunit ClpC